MARKQFEDANPLLAEFSTYQQWIGDYIESSGGIDAAVAALSDASPGFRVWLEGEQGRENFDISRAIFSPDAFMAQRGDRPTIYDTEAAGFDPASISAVQGLSGGQPSGEQSFFTKPFDEQTTDEKVATIVKAMRDYQLDVTRYNEQVAALLPPGQDPAIWGAPGTDWYEATLGKLLRQANIQTPQIPAILNAYQLWIPRAVAEGIEPTPLNYVKWYEQMFGPSPLAGTPTTPPPGPPSGG
jgi:hypothetical protein